MADQESKALRNRCNWMLNPHAFNKIHSLMGPMQERFLCAMSNKTISKAFSWRLDPEVEGTNSFNQNLAMARCYTNPPWCLIAWCLSQVRRQMARMVIITPLWNSWPWFPTILGLLLNFSSLLPARKHLIVLPTVQDKLIHYM